MFTVKDEKGKEHKVHVDDAPKTDEVKECDEGDVGPNRVDRRDTVAMGLFTRWSAFLLSGLMAFAYWIAHGTQAILPIVSRGELAALYCFLFLYISAHGSGIWSIDSKR